MSAVQGGSVQQVLGEEEVHVDTHTHTFYTFYTLLTLFSSNTSTILFRALRKNQKFDVCVCMCMYVYVQCHSSLTLSTSCSVVRPTWSSLQEPLPPVQYNMPDLQTTDGATQTVTKCASLCTRLKASYLLSASLVSEV